MNIELTHPFLRRCIDSKSLLNNCFKFSTFAYRLEKQAKTKATKGDGEIDEDIQNKYKGDGFELFVEAFIRVFGADMLIQIDPESFKMVDSDDDYGVDAIGTGNNGKIHTIQIKYRQANHLLTANGDHLTNFTSLSLMSEKDGGFGINREEKCQIRRKKIQGKCNMTIIHSGKEIHYRTSDKMLCEVVREINRKDIRRRVDENHIFWNCFRDSWKNADKVMGDNGEDR